MRELRCSTKCCDTSRHRAYFSVGRGVLCGKCVHVCGIGVDDLRETIVSINEQVKAPCPNEKWRNEERGKQEDLLDCHIARAGVAMAFSCCERKARCITQLYDS